MDSNRKPDLAVQDLLAAHGCAAISLERSGGPWSVRSRNFSGGRLMLCESREAFALRVNASDEHRIFVVPLDAGSTLVFQGQSIPDGGVGFSSRGVPVVLHAKTANRFAIVWVSRGIPRRGRIDGSLVLPPSSNGDTPIAQAIAGWAESGAGEFEGIVDQLIAKVPKVRDGGLPEDSSKPPRRVSTRLPMVLKIWDFILENAQDELNLETLMRESGKSSRTLEYAFTELVGRTPAGFIKLHRLQKARRLLLENRVRTVKQAACANGLWHFGRFSIDYRLQFGEHPSDTLKSSKTDAPQFQSAGG